MNESDGRGNLSFLRIDNVFFDLVSIAGLKKNQLADDEAI